MQYKVIGTTKVPAIGQGTQGIHDVNIIRRGIGLGMTFIDTAEVYDNEEIIGKAIKGIRDKVFISTKFSPEHNDDVIESCEGSLKRLDTDYIDLYQLHWATPSVPLEQTMKALYELRSSGKIRHAGICNMSHKEVEGLDINSIQIEYNLFDRSAEDLFIHCGKHDILLIAYSPLLDLYKLPPKRMLEFEQIVEDFKLTPFQLALNWIVSHKPVIAIPKTNNPLHQQLNAISSDFILPEEVYRKIDSLFPYEVNYIDPKLIKVSKVGKFPQTLKQAEENITHFVPSPLELSKDLEGIKPVRIEPRSDGFELIEGGLRYWAWVIKNGDKPIPALVKELRGTDL